MARLLRRLFAPIPAGALALGLVMGLALPLVRPWLQRFTPLAQLPISYVGVLADAEGRTGLVVSARRLGRELDVLQPAPLGLPDGHTLYLWTIEASGVARRIGPVPPGPSGRLALSGDVDTLLALAVELAVSLEPLEGPKDVPVGEFVYRGACERLWQVNPLPRWDGTTAADPAQASTAAIATAVASTLPEFSPATHMRPERTRYTACSSRKRSTCSAERPV